MGVARCTRAGKVAALLALNSKTIPLVTLVTVFAEMLGVTRTAAWRFACNPTNRVYLDEITRTWYAAAPTSWLACRQSVAFYQRAHEIRA